jgi:DNA-binding NarL/FixJ family response regulator
VWRHLATLRTPILDFYDRGGRRYIVLDRKHGQPLVTERQRQVLGYRAYCQTLATIAEELEVSVPTVANELAVALDKLGLSCDTDLPIVFGTGLTLLPAGGSERPPRPLPMTRLRAVVRRSPFSLPKGTRAESAAHRGRAAVRLSYPVPKTNWSDSLTSAEKDVAADILAGLANGAIGKKRGSSVRTVVNQVASIFKKIGAHSRLELSLVVNAGRTPPASAEPKRRRTRRSVRPPR